MRELVIRTTLGEELRAVPAGPAARLYAHAIDLGGWWAVGAIAALVLGVLPLGWLRGVLGPEVVDAGLGLALVWALWLGPAFDQHFHGVTRGQRLAGVRLMRENGDPPALADHLVLEALRPLDLLTPCLALALVGARRSLGERAAGLVLVHPGPGGDPA